MKTNHQFKMKRVIVALAFIGFAGSAQGFDGRMYLEKEDPKPMGERNGCVYSNSIHKVAMFAPTTSDNCPKYIEWREWEYTHTAKSCKYTATNGDPMTRADTDGLTLCYKHMHVTWYR